MKRKLTLVLILAIVSIMTLTACAPTSTSGSSASTAPESSAPASEAASESMAPAEGATSIGVSLDNLDDPYWVGLKVGIDKAVAELGDKVSVDMQICQGDATLQAKQIQDMLTAGANAIVCVYVDQEAIKQSIKLCNEKSVPFVYCDRPVASSDDAKVAWGIATDDLALSTNGWKWMVDYAKKNNIEKLKVLELVGSLTDANVLKRTKGFESVMAENPDLIERVQSVPTEWNLEKALAGVTNALQANPDINCIFMHSDYLLAPTIQALEAADRWKKIGEDGHVIVMPYSGNSLSLKSMSDGYVEMTFGMNTINNGYESLMAAYNIANGDTADYANVKDDPGFLITIDDFDTTAPMAYGYDGFMNGN